MNNTLNLEKFASALQTNAILEHAPDVWQAWLAELPLMNIGKSARLIHDALYELSLNHPTDYAHWLQILELFRPAIASLQNNVTETYLATDSQPLIKKLAIFGLIQNLQFSLVEAYSQLIYTHPDTNDKAIQHSIALAAHRIINYLTEVLLQSSQVYTCAPKGLWAKLHKTYHLALDLGLIDFLARHEIQVENTLKISIKASYQRALLIALANLYQLDFADMQKVYLILGQWAVKSQLRQEASDKYYINLNDDEPPIAKILHQASDTEKNWLSLDLTLLVAFIERLANHPKRNTDNTVTPGLLQHLLRNWGNAPMRAFPRIRQDSQMRVCIGLSSIHYHISSTDDNSIELPLKKKTLDDEFLASLTYDKKQTVDDKTLMLIPGELNKHLPKTDIWQPDFLMQKNAEDEELKARAASIKPKYNLYDWHVIDSSPTGYGLYSTTNWPETIKVGEIIGLQQCEQNIINPWLIGVIRWIKQTFEGELLLGIQLLITDASPILIDTLNDIANKPLRALFVKQADSESAQTIIAPNLPYPLNTNIHITYGHNAHNIVFTKLINQEGHFKWFEFRLCEPAK